LKLKVCRSKAELPQADGDAAAGYQKRTLKTGDDERKIRVAVTQRGHPSGNGGVRRRLPGAVYEALESLSTIAGIRT
jgi:hypothetical protein